MKFEVKRKYNLNVPSWDEIIKNLQYSIDNELPVEKKEDFVVCHDAYLIKEVMKMMGKLKASSAHLYINFYPKTDTFGKHDDFVDVIFWQVQGKTLWEVNKKKYTLNPGDIICIPKLVMHDVKPLTIRAGISFSI